MCQNMQWDNKLCKGPVAAVAHAHVPPVAGTASSLKTSSTSRQFSVQGRSQALVISVWTRHCSSLELSQQAVLAAFRLRGRRNYYIYYSCNAMCLSSARFCEESMQSMQSMLMQGYIPVAEYAINRVVSPKLRCLRSSELVAFPRLGSQPSTRTASKTNGTTDLRISGGQYDMTMESSGVLVFQGHFWCFLVTLCFLVILFYSVLWNWAKPWRFKHFWRSRWCANRQELFEQNKLLRAELIKAKASSMLCAARVISSNLELEIVGLCLW